MASEVKTASRKTEEAAAISAARGARSVAAPKVVTANRLSDGAVVYLCQDGRWTERIADALTAANKQEGGMLLAAAEQDIGSCQIVAPYLIDVARDRQGRIVPTTYRERIRAFGPSTRPEFGAHEARNETDVSLR